MTVSRPETPYEWPEPPAKGDLVHDSASDRIGQVQDHDGPRTRYALRPVGGGVEWDARLADLRPADPEQALRARVADANRQSRSFLDLFPRPEPQGTPGCGECLRLVRRRFSARERSDLSAVSDSNVLLRRHLQEAHRS